MIDVAWLAAFRILFGGVMAFSALRFIVYGWIAPLWIEPTFHFRYFGFGWVPIPGAPGMYALFGVLLALALCVAAGLWFRVTSVLFAIVFAYLQLLDVTTYLNHYYLVTLLAGLLAVSPAGRAWSIDVWRDPSRAVAEIPWTWHALLRAQVAVVYLGAGLAKLNADWLVHAQPLSIWLGSRSELPIIGALFEREHAALLLSWAGFLFDATIPLWLSIRRVRPFAFAALVVFHVTTRVLFPIGMFSAIMILSALVFFPPSWPRFSLPRKGVSLPPWPRAAVALAAVYVAIQIALPLRHLAYDGDVLWHEQGMRFSWRVMVREKNGVVTYAVRDPRTDRTWLVPARRYLTAVQERELGGQPDLILQLAHHVRDLESARVGGPVEVRAEALVSLNGRRAQLMIDPAVDLARVEDSLWPAAWILPVPASAPPVIRAVAAR